MKHRLHKVLVISFGIFLFANSNLLKASSCSAALTIVINQIKENKKKFSPVMPNQKMPWLDIKWVQKMLGEPRVKTVFETRYQWKNYSVIKGADGSNIAMGSFPGGREATYDITEVTRILGTPQIISKKLTQYDWECLGKISKGKLSILMDQNGKVVNVSGQNCDEASCSGIDFSF